MSNEKEYKFFQLRKQAKTYISKVFSYDSQNTERLRNVKMVIEGNDEIQLAKLKVQYASV